jgi:hypothetical protein
VKTKIKDKSEEYDFVPAERSLLGDTLHLPEESSIEGTARDREDVKIAKKSSGKYNHVIIPEKGVALSRKELPELYKMAKAKKALKYYRNSRRGYWGAAVLWAGGTVGLGFALETLLPNPEGLSEVITIIYGFTGVGWMPAIARALHRKNMKKSVSAYNKKVKQNSGTGASRLIPTQGKGFGSSLKLSPVLLTPRSIEKPMPDFAPGLKLRLSF